MKLLFWTWSIGSTFCLFSAFFHPDLKPTLPTPAPDAGPRADANEDPEDECCGYPTTYSPADGCHCCGGLEMAFCSYGATCWVSADHPEGRCAYCQLPEGAPDGGAWASGVMECETCGGVGQTCCLGAWCKAGGECVGGACRKR